MIDSNLVIIAASTTAVGGGSHPMPPPSTPEYSQVKFEKALDFLDQVKLQFANQPQVYKLFLNIMKDFKAQR